MQHATFTIAIALAAASAVFGSTQAQQSPAPQVSLPPDVLDQSQAAKLPDNKMPTRVPDIVGKSPAVIAPGADAHIGRLWITPVLIQQSGGSAGDGRATGAVVRVSRPGESGGRQTDEAKAREQLQGQLEASQAAQAAPRENGGSSGGDVGGSSQALTAGQLNNAAVQLEQAKESDDRNSIRQSEIDIAAKERAAENSERRMCRREARNAWESFTGFFGAKHTEECPSSVRRRTTVTTAAMNALGVKNTLYFINLSAANSTTVQITCRIRDQSTLISANVSVAPLDYGEWEPPCACDRDYKFWCTLASPEPIAAHAIATQTSGAAKSLEYIDFFLGR